MDAVTIVKEIAKKGSTVYNCSLDASKAFERVNTVVLLQKMSKSNVPLKPIKILEYALLNTHAAVEFNGGKSRIWFL